MNIVKQFFSKRTIKLSRSVYSLDPHSRLKIISRAHQIYFSHKCLLSYEDIMIKWLNQMGFVVLKYESVLNPGFIQFRCKVRSLYPIEELSYRSVEFATRTY